METSIYKPKITSALLRLPRILPRDKIDTISRKKEKYTTLLVTHNMHQAGRVSDKTGFFYLGDLNEFGDTEQIFTNPKQKQTENYISGRFG